MLLPQRVTDLAMIWAAIFSAVRGAQALPLAAFSSGALMAVLNDRSGRFAIDPHQVLRSSIMKHFI
jgi:hypothetical protein